jgi:hypothetical protein
MEAPGVHPMSARYTLLSDRFRSLWTFSQFLAGVFKHQGDGPVPFTYDFQALHGRMEQLIPKIGTESDETASRELDQLERELERIHRDLARIEGGFSPSVLRKFFDHIKRQDEKVLGALLKFYLMSSHFERDTLDKLDILFTRLAEEKTNSEEIIHRDPADLQASFGHLIDFTGFPPLPPAEEAPLVEAVRETRRELELIEDYPSLVGSKVYDRYRSLKQRFGKSILYPPILIEVTATNIVAKNRFREFFEAEEKKVLENTSRIYDIERYLERHPELASDELKGHIEEFRRIRVHYDASRRLGNVKREDIAGMTRAMNAVLAQFDPISKRPVGVDEEETGADPVQVAWESEETPTADDLLGSTDPAKKSPAARSEGTSLSDVLPPDPLLNETLHKIMFALEMVVWDRLPEQVTEAPEIRNLKLEPWEISTYRQLAEGKVIEGTGEWELDRFLLQSAALRVKMEDERVEINRLEEANNPDRLFEVLEGSAQSLERAREVSNRFQWFIDDMLFRGETQKMEQIYRSRFRFLYAYSGLWLDHQRSGGLTPL